MWSDISVDQLTETEGINQNDVHERNHQVGQMRVLFSTAASTIAWLGEMGSNSDLAYSAVSAPRRSLGFVNDETRRAMEDLLNRRYWSRVWVIQEFLLPLHLHVWWSGCRIAADDLRQVVWGMAQLSSGSKPRYPHIWDTPGRTLLRYRVNYQRMRDSVNDASLKAFRESMRLQFLLRSFSESQCSLWHDRVYGLLGIATDTAHSTWPIVPNYESSREELLLNVLQNQRREESDPADDTWRFVRVLCKTLELEADQLFAVAFHNASKPERELYILKCRPIFDVPYSHFGHPLLDDIPDWDKNSAGCGFLDLCFLLKYILRRLRDGGGCVDSVQSSMTAMRQERTEIAALKSSVRSIRQREGCLVALREYLNSCPLDVPRILPSFGASIKALIVGLREIKTARPTERGSRWYNTNTSKVTKLLFSRGQQTFYLGRSHLVFMHKSLAVHTGTERLSAVSYHSFGEFGIALLLLKCRKDCNCYPCQWTQSSPDPKVVGTAFFYKL